MYKAIMLFFILFGTVAALYAVNVKSVVRAVFAMFAAFFSVSAMLVFAHAEFLAIAHLMVYIGGIIVVMIFAIMLSSKSIVDDSENANPESKAYKFTKLISGIACVFLFIILANIIIDTSPKQEVLGAKVNTVQHFGTELLSTYAFPLEIISLLLLVALMAASIISRKERSDA
jgi:NAD(P)H-quinone oxidoreductase subunit 6